jgi:hypothetical protein
LLTSAKRSASLEMMEEWNLSGIGEGYLDTLIQELKLSHNESGRMYVGNDSPSLLSNDYRCDFLHSSVSLHLLRLKLTCKV